MNKILKNTVPFILLLLLFVVFGTDLFAAGPPCDPSPGCTVNCCEAIPLDGGLSALIIAGIAYGAKKIYGNSKKEKN
ncbi:MAG: hypothetical protein COA97_06750 [Flavobacteriales bacterium]|nr:MAG: hypothetical protein COA97_06750 [Flavobacteriales bacterium]